MIIVLASKLAQDSYLEAYFVAVLGRGKGSPRKIVPLFYEVPPLVASPYPSPCCRHVAPCDMASPLCLVGEGKMIQWMAAGRLAHRFRGTGLT